MGIKQIVGFLVVLFTIQLTSAQEVVKRNGLFVNVESNEPYSGIYISYHNNGEKESVYTLKKGREHGKAEFYYPSGEIMEQGSFKLGQKDGKWVRWSEAGNKLAEAFYLNGKKDGKWEIWDETGTKRYQMFYNEGAKVGEWVMWDEKGQIANKKDYSTE